MTSPDLPAVHMVGGVCALIGAKMLGPRIGKYGKDGKPRAILGHNLTFAALGVFILWFCWFGFNGASTVGMDTDELIVSAGLVFFNTNLCTAVACCTTLIFTWLRYGKPDVSMTYNAALAGLVGITAGCDAVSPLGAAVMGIVFGLVIVLAVEFFDKVAKIDDPVGAISVHGVCGALGTILTGLFATGVSTEKGVFYGGGFHFFGVQCLGVASVIALCGCGHHHRLRHPEAHHRPAGHAGGRDHRSGCLRARPAHRLCWLRYAAGYRRRGDRRPRGRHWRVCPPPRPFPSSVSPPSTLPTAPPPSSPRWRSSARNPSLRP